MSEHRWRRGIFLPSLGQLLVLAAAVCAAWLLWSETRNLDEGDTPPSDGPTEQLQSFDALVSEGRDAIPDLVAMLSDRDPKIRRNAVIALGRIGPEAGESLEPIRERLHDDDGTV